MNESFTHAISCYFSERKVDKRKEEAGCKKKVGGGDEDAVCDSVIHEVQFNVNCEKIS